MAFTIGGLLEAVLLVVNAMAILQDYSPPLTGKPPPEDKKGVRRFLALRECCLRTAALRGRGDVPSFGLVEGAGARRRGVVQRKRWQGDGKMARERKGEREREIHTQREKEEMRGRDWGENSQRERGRERW
jgi:hypothetical protein